jgi:hypothetical protein
MIIYFRVCEKQQTISNVLRFENLNKTEMIKRCWLSLQKSVTKEDTIVLVYDSVSSETLTWLQHTAITDNLVLVEVPEHSWDYHLHTVVLVNTLEAMSHKYPDELHYILEDDYLHVPNSLDVLKNTLKDWEHFAVSYDYPDRYYLNPEPTRVMLGIDRHWRTVTSSTMTVLAKGKTWLRYIESLKVAATTSNDQVFVEIYKQQPCISPLPGLSSHMTQHHITPLVNWQEIWNNQNV